LKIGITAFLSDRTIGPAQWAQEVEQRGFYSLYLPEHTHLPVSAQTPPSLVGGVSLDDYPRSLDPFVALGAAAAVTSEIVLGTGVSLVAQHDAIVLAKQIATLDHISGGRVVLGMGFGWNKVEAADHGVSFEDRRAVAREKVLCMKELWSKEEARLDGTFVKLPPSLAWPKPVSGRVPILIGGAANKANFEAIADYGDGWMPIGGAGISKALTQLKLLFESKGRDPAELRVVPFGTIPDPQKLEHLADAGCTEVVLRVPAEETSRMLETIDSYRVYLDSGYSDGGANGGDAS
jgi:probable F420-dependent oxidoreductase